MDEAIRSDFPRHGRFAIKTIDEVYTIEEVFDDLDGKRSMVRKVESFGLVHATKKAISRSSFYRQNSTSSSHHVRR